MMTMLTADAVKTVAGGESHARSPVMRGTLRKECPLFSSVPRVSLTALLGDSLTTAIDSPGWYCYVYAAVPRCRCLSVNSVSALSALILPLLFFHLLSLSSLLFYRIVDVVLLLVPAFPTAAIVEEWYDCLTDLYENVVLSLLSPSSPLLLLSLH
jgi:hypothetical protein